MGKSYHDSGVTKPADKSAAPKTDKSAAPKAEKRGHDRPVAAAGEPRERSMRGWDAGLTLALLGLGVVAVLVSIPQYADLFDALNTAYAQMERPQYNSREVAEAVGLALNIGQIVILVLAIWLSVRALRAGRLAFYIPILGGIAMLILIFAMSVVLVTGDPAFMDSLTTP